MQEVSLELVMKQRANGEEEVNRYTYQGKGVEKGGQFYITYKEQIEGIGDVNTVIKLEGAKISLLRQGALTMKQEFEKGQSSLSTYQSPYGVMPMEVHTRKLAVTWIEGRPQTISIDYQLWLSEQYAGEFEWRLTLNWVS